MDQGKREQETRGKKKRGQEKRKVVRERDDGKARE